MTDAAMVAAEQALREKVLSGPSGQAPARLDAVVDAGGPRQLAMQTGQRVWQVTNQAKLDIRALRDVLRQEEYIQDTIRLGRYALEEATKYSLQAIARTEASIAQRGWAAALRGQAVAEELTLSARAARLAPIAARIGMAPALVELLPYVTVILVLVLAVGLTLYFSQGRPSTKQVAHGPNRDCPAIDAGLLNGAYQEQCESVQAQMVALYSRAGEQALKLQTKNGKIVGGAVLCDVVAEGPNAWPRQDGPINPPPPPGGKICTVRSGLVQSCAK